MNSGNRDSLPLIAGSVLLEGSSPKAASPEVRGLAATPPGKQVEAPCYPRRRPPPGWPYRSRELAGPYRDPALFHSQLRQQPPPTRDLKPAADGEGSSAGLPKPRWWNQRAAPDR